MKTYETVSSVLGSLYCGYSLDAANDAFIERHEEITVEDQADNLALFEDGEVVRVYWGGISPSVAQVYEQITTRRIEHLSETLLAEGRASDEWKHEAAQQQRLK